MAQQLFQRADLSALHDAELCLVQMDSENERLLLGFRNLDGTISNYLFGGILTYRIDNIQRQNVVSRIMASNTASGFGDDLEKTARWTSSAGNTLLIPEDTLRGHVATIISGGLQLVYVDPSWGAEIGVIAETATLTYGRSEANS